MDLDEVHELLQAGCHFGQEVCIVSAVSAVHASAVIMRLLCMFL